MPIDCLQQEEESKERTLLVKDLCLCSPNAPVNDCRERQKLRRAARKGSEGAEAALQDGPAPVMSTATAGLLSVVSEAFADALADYVEENPDALLKDKVSGLMMHPRGATPDTSCWREPL